MAGWSHKKMTIKLKLKQLDNKKYKPMTIYGYIKLD